MRTFALAAALLLAPAAYAQDQIPPGLHAFSDGDAVTADDQQFMLDFHFIYRGGGPEVAQADKAMRTKFDRPASLAMMNACAGPMNAYVLAKLNETRSLVGRFTPHILKYYALKDASDYSILAFRGPSSLAEMRVGLANSAKERARILALPDNPAHPEWKLSNLSIVARIDLDRCAVRERARLGYGVTL